MAKKKASTPKRIRASWSGALRFGLVSFPVEALNAHAPGEGTLALHQLHAECHSRIRYEKHCPIHGKVSNDEIISAYEYGKDKYIEITEDELDKLYTDQERALTIDHFIDPDEIDPIYCDGRMYYLIPKGQEAQEPYAVFLGAMERQGKYGLGQVVFSGKEQLALLRPREGVLAMMMLNYEAEIRKPADIHMARPRLTGKKVELATTLIKAWGEGKFEFAEYRDRFHDKLQALIEAKIEGKKVVVPEAEEEPEVINLMDALKKSVAAAGTSKRNTTKKPARKTSRRGTRRRAS